MPNVNSLVPVPQYREQRQHLFHSDGSLQWFMRQHRQELVDRGALLIVAGRTQINPESFDAVVIDAGTKAAKKAGTS